VCIILLVVFSAGCTSSFSNLTTTQHNLKLNEFAIFEKEGNRFASQITKVEGESSSSRIYAIDVTIRVKNTGDKPISLMAYPAFQMLKEINMPGIVSFWG